MCSQASDDVGAKQEIFDIMVELAQQGLGMNYYAHLSVSYLQVCSSW